MFVHRAGRFIYGLPSAERVLSVRIHETRHRSARHWPGHSALSRPPPVACGSGDWALVSSWSAHQARHLDQCLLPRPPVAGEDGILALVVVVVTQGRGGMLAWDMLPGGWFFVDLHGGLA